MTQSSNYPRTLNLAVVFVIWVLYPSIVVADCPDKIVVCYTSKGAHKMIPKNEFKSGSCWEPWTGVCSWCSEDAKKRASEECQKRFGPDYNRPYINADFFRE